MRLSGIDEAGYGPLLGPLAVVAVTVAAEDADTVARSLAPTGVRDSKRVHDPDDLGAIESIALPALTWLLGRRPGCAAEVFAALGETGADRTAWPWLAGAEALRLPAGTHPIPTWRPDGIAPVRLDGALFHAHHLNAARRAGTNRAEVELARVLYLIAAAWTDPQPHRCWIDRLGGRRYYAEALGGRFRACRLTTLREEPAVASYRLELADRQLEVGFHVGGESVSPLVAMASCIAKYARELSLRLLNAWGASLVPGLKPTAGYPLDARRWLAEMERAGIAIPDDLVRK